MTDPALTFEGLGGIGIGPSIDRPEGKAPELTLTGQKTTTPLYPLGGTVHHELNGPAAAIADIAEQAMQRIILVEEDFADAATNVENLIRAVVAHLAAAGRHEIELANG